MEKLLIINTQYKQYGGEDSNIDATPAETSTVAAPSNFSLDTNNVKKNKVDEFDTLFDDKEGKTDDLPF